MLAISATAGSRAAVPSLFGDRLTGQRAPCGLAPSGGRSEPRGTEDNTGCHLLASVALHLSLLDARACLTNGGVEVRAILVGQAVLQLSQQLQRPIAGALGEYRSGAAGRPASD